MIQQASNSNKMSAIQKFSEFASTLKVDDIEASTLKVAKCCLIDAVGCAVHGSKLPWSKIVMDMADNTGLCRLPGIDNRGYSVRDSALVFGACAHAFELDNLRKPGAGVHPGATIAIPALMMAQTVNASGADLLRAIVIGCEVQFRIGAATLHTPEKIGFHAPGITGPFGAAAACGALLKFNPARFANAFGIAASMASGLLAFAKADQGGMIKRLHLGRAAEGGVLASLLAQKGFEGPHSALEGQFGILQSYCEAFDTDLLTKDLGYHFETNEICFKSFACHITAHAPIQLLQELLKTHGYTGEAIHKITIRGSEKMVSHHNIPEPTDPLMAQYSIPYAVALAAFEDPLNPATFENFERHDERVKQLARKIDMETRVINDNPSGGWGVEMKIEFLDGFTTSGAMDVFDGCPEKPLTSEAFKQKFMSITRHLNTTTSAALYDKLTNIENITNIKCVFS